MEETTANPKAAITVELRQLVGKFQDRSGQIRRKAWDVDLIFVNGTKVGQVGHKPGLGVSIYGGATVSKREEEAIAAAVTTKRGMPPAHFAYSKPATVGQVLDEGEEGESDEYVYE